MQTNAVCAPPKACFRLHPRFGKLIETYLPILCILAGLWNKTPGLYYRGVMTVFCYNVTFMVGGGVLVHYFGKKYKFDLCQPNRRQTVDLCFHEIYGTMRNCLGISLIAGWTWAAIGRGEDTMLSWNFIECYGPFGLKAILFMIMQSGIVWLFADAWTYFKHYCLHKYFFVLHKEHHAFHDPTPLAGFSLGFAESIWTFGLGLQYLIPISPFGKLWIPLHFGQIFGFMILNLYLHSGFLIPIVETILPCFLINTSSFHNIHHEKTHVNYAEVSPFWDYMLGTYDKERYNRYQTKYSFINLYKSLSSNNNSKKTLSPKGSKLIVSTKKIISSMMKDTKPKASSP